MAVTLRQASDRQGYALSDRPTFEALKGSLRLEIVWGSDPRLVNTYAVIRSRRGPRRADTAAFETWLLEGTGREAIAAYRIRGSTTPPFTVWPSTAGHMPHSLP